MWLGFELFGLRVQVCSQLVQFTLTRKGYDNHPCHNKSQTGNGAGEWMTSCPENIGWEFGRFWKRFSWVPTMVWRSWGPTMVPRSWVRPRCWAVRVRPWCWEVGVRPWCREVGSHHGVEQLGSDHDVEKLGSDHGVENLGPTMVLRIGVRPWCWEVEVRPWCWEVGVSTLGHTVEFFGSLPAEINWDLTHHKMCRTLGVLFA